MTKARPLKKRLDNFPKLRLKEGVKLKKHDPFETLLDENLIDQAFLECIKEKDTECAVEVVFIHLKALLHATIGKKELRQFVIQAIEKAIENEKDLLLSAYSDANRDRDRIAVINDWDKIGD